MRTIIERPIHTVTEKVTIALPGNQAFYADAEFTPYVPPYQKAGYIVEGTAPIYLRQLFTETFHMDGNQGIFLITSHGPFMGNLSMIAEREDRRLDYRIRSFGEPLEYPAEASFTSEPIDLSYKPAYRMTLCAECSRTFMGEGNENRLICRECNKRHSRSNCRCPHCMNLSREF